MSDAYIPYSTILQLFVELLGDCFDDNATEEIQKKTFIKLLQVAYGAYGAYEPTGQGYGYRDDQGDDQGCGLGCGSVYREELLIIDAIFGLP